MTDALDGWEKAVCPLLHWVHNVDLLGLRTHVQEDWSATSGDQQMRDAEGMVETVCPYFVLSY